LSAAADVNIKVETLAQETPISTVYTPTIRLGIPIRDGNGSDKLGSKYIYFFGQTCFKSIRFEKMRPRLWV